MPFGIEHLPSQSAGISPAKPPALKNGILPFGLEHIPNNDNYESQITETNSEPDTKQIGIEDEFPKNVQNTPEKSTNSSIYSDANLIFYNSKNIPKVEIAFKDIFPTNLGGIDLVVDAGDVEYIRVDASFRFMYYEFKLAT